MVTLQPIEAELTAENREWLDDFRKKHGRNPKVLHIGNVANNAYNNCKVLNDVGIECDVLCYDYYHIMGTPEWEDADFVGSIPDHFFPQWHRINLNGFQRPPWFVQGRFTTCVSYLVSRHEGRVWATWFFGLLLSLQCRFPALLGSNVFLNRLTLGWLQAPTRILASLSPTNGQGLSKHPIAQLLLVFLLLPAISASAAVGAALSVVCSGILGLCHLGMESLRWLNRPGNTVTWIKSILDESPTRAKSVGEMADAYFGTFFFRRQRSRYAIQFCIQTWYLLWITIGATLLAAVAVTMWPIVVIALVVKAVLGQTRYARETRGLWDEFQNRLDTVANDFRNAFPERKPMNLTESRRYFKFYQGCRRLFPYYDVVQGYALDPMWPYLCQFRPYVAFEHGTLRIYPWLEELDWQMTSLAYRGADHTFVTNGDCLQYAKKLGITSFSASLHGIDDRKFQPNRSFRENLKKKYAAARLYFCPLRHDWDVKGTDQYLRAIPAMADALGPSFRVFFVRWGEQLPDSLDLIQRLGVEQYVVWLEPMPKRTLVRWIGAMDCIFDQIKYPCFGGTAPESLGCGTPVIMSYDHETTKWIIAEPAPILAAWNAVDIVGHVLQLLEDEYWRHLSNQGRQWFARNHSSTRIANDHLGVYRRILCASSDIAGTIQPLAEATAKSA